MKQLKKELRVLGYFIGQIFKVDKGFFLAMCAQAIISSVLPFVNIYLPRILIEELTGQARIDYLLILVGAIVAINFLSGIINSLLSKATSLGDKKINNYFYVLFNRKLTSVAFEKIEDPDFIDLKERALFPVASRGCINDLTSLVPKMLSQIIILIGTLYIILTFDIIIIAVLVITVAVNFIVAARFQEKEIKAQKQTVKSNKEYGYYINLIENKPVGLELRLYRAQDYVIGRINRSYDQMLTNFEKAHAMRQKPLTLKLIVNGAQSAAVFFYIAYQTIKKPLTLGQFSSYIGAAGVFTASLSELLNQILKLRETCRYLDDFAELCSMPSLSDGTGKQINSVNEISFENVSFKYPKADTWVLKNINLTIKSGESLSVVGKNGAGKSTLIKLIARLYEPTEGRVLVDGVDVREFDFQSYRKLLSVVFQDFKLFGFSVSGNICSDSPFDEKVMSETLERAGVAEHISTLEKGVNTLVGKHFDDSGTEFSGGQLQKLAIARAIYRNASIIIMDEPTAALDPFAEAEVYEKFNDLRRGKTAIYISHRLSSCKFCDRIIFIGDGRILEEGTHEELMRIAGPYALMFNLQAAAFAKKDSL